MKKETVSDIPPLGNVSEKPAESRDIRIPNSSQNKAQAAPARPEGAPSHYIYPGDPQYERLAGAWAENKQPGNLTVGNRDYQVISPDGYPVFIPLNVSLDAAYGSLSGGITRK